MTQQEKHRFTDEKLQEFYNEFQLHIEEEEDMHHQTQQAIETNTKLVTEVHESTKGLIEAWDAAQGTVKTVAVFGRLVKWSAGIILAVGTVIYFLKNGHPPH